MTPQGGGAAAQRASEAEPSGRRAESGELALRFAPEALERCFLAADVLAEDHGETRMEYALLGLSTERDPFCVVETPLLPGQLVTNATVVQPGRQVLRMRGEIDQLSRLRGVRLVPVAFVHRHPGPCDASLTDHAFLSGPFVDQVSTVLSFPELAGTGTPPGCGCRARRGGAAPRGEVAAAFSLIVNRERDHRLYAVRRSGCPHCGRVEVGRVPARLVRDGLPPLTEPARAAVRGRLAAEIGARVRMEPHPPPAPEPAAG